MTSRDGDVYEGEWKDGKKHGKGKLITKDGKCFLVKFEEGAWIGGVRIWIGVFVYMNQTNQ